MAVCACCAYRTNDTALSLDPFLSERFQDVPYEAAHPGESGPSTMIRAHPAAASFDAIALDRSTPWRSDLTAVRMGQYPDEASRSDLSPHDLSGTGAARLRFPAGAQCT